MNAPTRRGLLGGATLLAAAPMIGGPHPDADLIAACAEFDAIEQAYIATYAGRCDDGSDEVAAVIERERLAIAQEPLVSRMCQMRAATREGVAARARSLALWEGDNALGDVNCEYVNGRLLGAILRDLLAGSLPT